MELGEPNVDVWRKYLSVESRRKQRKTIEECQEDTPCEEGTYLSEVALRKTSAPECICVCVERPYGLGFEDECCYSLSPPSEEQSGHHRRLVGRR